MVLTTQSHRLMSDLVPHKNASIDRDGNIKQTRKGMNIHFHIVTEYNLCEISI